MKEDKNIVSALAAAEFPHPPENEKQRPAGTLDNLKHMLDEYGVVVRYNVIKKKVELLVPGHTGSSDNLHNAGISKVVSFAALNKLPLTQVYAYLDAIANENPYNPVKNWIESSPWDGQDRVTVFCETLGVTEDYPTELRNALLRKWLISAAAAVYMERGFKARGVLTLQGAQGLGKTSWVRNLISDPVLQEEVIKVDHHLDGNNKDSVLGAITNWVVEIGELDSSFRKDIARLKGFLTSDQDRVRRPYAREESEYSRRTVFCATVNEHNFLVDPTGNTRFWTVSLDTVNFNHGIDVQQLWAQVAELYKKGEQWWLTKEEEQLLEQTNGKHIASSVVRDTVLSGVDVEDLQGSGALKYTASGLLKELGIKVPTNAQSKECASVLRGLGLKSSYSKGSDRWLVKVNPVKEDKNGFPIFANGQQDDDDLF